MKPIALAATFAALAAVPGPVFGQSSSTLGYDRFPALAGDSIVFTAEGDRGIATAAEVGVFGPEGHWLIEGHGVDPDMVVDNLPRATYDGQDAQLEAAIAELQAEIKAHPIPAPKVPAYPRKGGS